jgi:hypothetical protein
MKVFLKILIFSVFAISCQNADNKDNNQLITFDLKELPEVTGVKLSDLGFDDNEYIPLETNEQSIISGTDDLFMRNKIVIGERKYLMQRFSTILEFQTDGKFITRIGTKGRGPEEFTAAHDVNIKKVSKDIYLLTRWQNKYFVYSKSGKFLRTFQCPLNTTNFKVTGDGILCYNMNSMGNVETSYNLIDKDGREIKSFSNKYR